MIKPAKLATALRKKYGTTQSGARKVLRRLGLDEATLGAPQMGTQNDMAALRVELERLCGEHGESPLAGKIFKALERIPLDHGADAEPPRDLETALPAIAARLKQRGLSESDVLDILSVIGTDCLKAQDEIPANGAAGGFGGKFADSYDHIEPEKPDREQSARDRRRGIAADSAMHSSSTTDRLDRKFPGFSRIRTN